MLKNKRQELNKIVKKYFKGEYQTSLNVIEQIESKGIDGTQISSFQKLLQIFFIGELVGLPTLNSILQKFNIKSNRQQINYKKICKSLTVSKLRSIFEYIFEHEISKELIALAQKDKSNWSREFVTVVLDDSVFKQWLDQRLVNQGLDQYYGKYFSGQFGTSVYGYKVVTLGVSINGIFYPLYFDFAKKGQKSTSKPIENPYRATAVAEKLIKKWGILVEKFKKAGTKLPELHLSCDSGYNDANLAQSCKNNYLIYISVPKKSHSIEFDGKKRKLSELIEKDFKTLEKQHQQKQQNLPNTEKTVFNWRFRAKYLSKNEEVTFLAFRLNGSKKVSIIFSPDKNIFAKTLRRHWFQRTYIEQFFKLLKHVLLIQEARVTNKEDFEIKLLRFAFVGWHAQKLVKYVRRQLKDFAKKGFITIQRILSSDEDTLDILQTLVASKN
jgi:hypothetical protein